jgi:hypothetical protein
VMDSRYRLALRFPALACEPELDQAPYGFGFGGLIFLFGGPSLNCIFQFGR